MIMFILLHENLIEYLFLFCLIQTNVENIQEDVLAALDNKNPSVKAETAAFLARCFTKCTPIVLNKKLLKGYSAALIKALNEPGTSFVTIVLAVNTIVDKFSFGT